MYFLQKLKHDSTIESGLVRGQDTDDSDYIEEF